MSWRDKADAWFERVGKWVLLVLALGGVITIAVLSFTIPYC